MGRTASHPYTKKNGVALVGVRTVVRYAHKHSPSFSSQSRWLLETNFLRIFCDSFVEGFGEPICGRIISSRGDALYSEFVAEAGEDGANELRAVVMHNSPWHSIAVDDVVLDKFHYVSGFDLPQRNCFRPLGEVVSDS